MRAFGPILKKFRKMKNISQSGIARQAGCVPSALGDYERDAKSPRVEMREKIARIMDVDPVEMMGLDLTEEDEIRILNKLLIKYCSSIGTMTEDNNGTKKVIVTFPESFVPLQKAYVKYKGTDEEKMEFWLENWPEFDYMRHPDVNDEDVLNKELSKRFEDYQKAISNSEQPQKED